MMKKLIATALGLSVALVYVAACVDYSDANATPEAGTAPSPRATATGNPGDAAIPTVVAPDASDTPATCGSRSFRGGDPGAVVCPGTASCQCGGDDVCCMAKIDSLTGACTSLAACRTLALQCDGPEDCDGGVCCLEDRTGGGSSCKSAASCDAGKWLCRTDADCVNAAPGPRCAPIDLGTQGIDDVGLDGIVGVCGK